MIEETLEGYRLSTVTYHSLIEPYHCTNLSKMGLFSLSQHEIMYVLLKFYFFNCWVMTE